jgi:hypothetical protein
MAFAELIALREQIPNDRESKTQRQQEYDTKDRSLRPPDLGLSLGSGARGEIGLFSRVLRRIAVTRSCKQGGK